MSDLETNIDIADSSKPNSASGSAVMAAARLGGYGGLSFEVVQGSHHVSHVACMDSDFGPMPELANEMSLEFGSADIHMVELARLMRRWVLQPRWFYPIPAV